MAIINKDLRMKIAQMVYDSKDGHIPSSFSIIDIIELLYREYLRVEPNNPNWPERDYFILSKGHGCVALYVVLHKYGFITDHDIKLFCKPRGILGEHPDVTKVPGVEASTGSLGHGFPYAVGIALGLKIQKKNNRIFILVGDGECHEGTIWEAANVAVNLQLGNLLVFIDQNGSAKQLMPIDDLAEKWKAFGWNVYKVDGHSEEELKMAIDSIEFQNATVPSVILAATVKGKGVSFLEGHGTWHHRIPQESEMMQIKEELSC